MGVASTARLAANSGSAMDKGLLEADVVLLVAIGGIRRLLVGHVVVGHGGVLSLEKPSLSNVEADTTDCYIPAAGVEAEISHMVNGPGRVEGQYCV